MEKRYLEPEMEIVSFAATDVILASPAQPAQYNGAFETGTAGALVP